MAKIYINELEKDNIIKTNKHGETYIESDVFVNGISEMIDSGCYNDVYKIVMEIINLLSDDEDGTFKLAKLILKNVSNLIDRNERSTQYILKAAIESINDFDRY